MFHTGLTRVALFSAGVSALTLNTPFPSPTVPPQPYDLRRQEAPQRTLLAAPDPTCGYINGASDSPWGCSTGNCVFATPTSASTGNQPVAGSVLCCDPKTGCPAAPAPTACIEKGSIASCTGSCLDDPATLKCTSGIDLYCASISFPTPLISAIFCTYTSNSNSSAIVAKTAYSGQSSRSFTPTVAQFAVSTSTQVTTSTSHAPVKTSSAGSANPTESNSAPAKSSKRGTIIGAAVGGALGGLAVLGAAIWCLVSRKSAEKAEKEEKARSSSTAVSEPLGHTVVVRAAGKS